MATITAAEMIPTIGTSVLIWMEGLQVEVTVQNVRSVWGKQQIEVRPVAGAGVKWVDILRVIRSAVNR